MSVATTRHTQPAQAITEFALVIILLMMVVLGVVDLGRGIYSYNTLASAAREGARLKGITNSALAQSNWNTFVSDIKTQVMTTAIINLDPNKITVSCTGSCARGDQVTVKVQYVFIPATPLFPTLTLTGLSNMTME